jgi:hypothetical protein
MIDKTQATDPIAEVMAHLNEPYDPVQVVKDLLEHAVFDEARSDECTDAVENARGYLEQEASNPPPLIAFKLEASGEPIMTIHTDGRVTLNEDATPQQGDK